MDLFGGTCSTEKAWLLLDNHSHSIGCDNDEDYVKGKSPSLVETFTFNVLNPESDIPANDDVVVAPKVYD